MEDAAAAGPLALKPRAYYVAKHCWQRARIVRARRSGAPAAAPGVRLLGYHRVADEPDELAVAPARFRAQMEALLASGAEPVSLDDALALLERGTSRRHVCVTFDDGYRDNLEQAAPVLRALGIPATIFVPTAVIDGAARFSWYRSQPPLLGWDELRELAGEPLFSVGAHTRTHPSLPQLTDGEAREEIAGSKRDLEQRLGRPVTAFCYPAGRFGEREARLVGEAGFRAGVTCEPGLNRPPQPAATLRRTMVDRRDTLADFEAKLAGLLDAPSPLRERLHRRRSAA